MFKGKLKKPYRKSMNFASLTEARDYIKNVRTDSSLIMTPSPKWTLFEGEFDFTYKCPEGKKTCFEKEDSLKNAIKTEIMKTYPFEDWEISDRGGSWTTIDLIISCNKALSDKFNLFYRDTSYFGKWRPYKLDLTTFWTTKQKVTQQNVKENFLDTFLLSLKNELPNLFSTQNKTISVTAKFKAMNTYLTTLLPRLTTTSDTIYLSKKKNNWLKQKTILIR